MFASVSGALFDAIKPTHHCSLTNAGFCFTDAETDIRINQDI